MATAVVMPQMGLEVTEGTVIAIHPALGARVARDEPVVELSTDKADTDVLAPCDGFVRAILVEIGDTVPVGATLLTLAESMDAELDDEPGTEPATDAAGAEATAGGAEATADAPATAPAAMPDAPATQPAAVPDAPAAPAGAPRLGPHPIRAAPIARRLAGELGIDLATIVGSGPRGRVTVADVRAATPTTAGSRAPAAPHAPAAPDAVEPLTRMRRAIARRMAASQREIPQFHLERSVDLSHVLAIKDAQRAAGAPVSVNDLLLQALGEVARRHPLLRATFADGDEPALRHREQADIGLAVATGAGLVVPVIRRADALTLREIAAERSRLVDAARAGTLDLREMTGGVITLSNLGGFGIDRFAAMVNPGESAILAVGRSVDRLVPHRGGIRVVPETSLTMTFDHRVIDGAVGAEALGELGELLEGAMRWRT